MQNGRIGWCTDWKAIVSLEVIVASGTLTLTVTAIADSRFKFSDVKFKDDTLGDLSWARGASDYIAVITDTDLDNENCSYSVIIVDNGAGGINLPCDPPITNKPRPLAV